jgi:hypothetical protein
MPGLSARRDERLSAQVKPRALPSDDWSVAFVHACAFCGWSRAAATAVVLPAGCPDCGCAVDSREDDGAPRAAEAPAPGLPSSRPLRAALWVFGLALLYTAARAGNSFAGLSGAITAVGIAGFLLVPFVPERLGPSR